MLLDWEALKQVVHQKLPLTKSEHSVSVFSTYPCSNCPGFQKGRGEWVNGDVGIEQQIDQGGPISGSDTFLAFLLFRMLGAP